MFEMSLDNRLEVEELLRTGPACCGLGSDAQTGRLWGEMAGQAHSVTDFVSEMDFAQFGLTEEQTLTLQQMLFVGVAELEFGSGLACDDCAGVIEGPLVLPPLPRGIVIGAGVVPVTGGYLGVVGNPEIEADFTAIFGESDNWGDQALASARRLAAVSLAVDGLVAEAGEQRFAPNIQLVDHVSTPLWSSTSVAVVVGAEALNDMLGLDLGAHWIGFQITLKEQNPNIMQSGIVVTERSLLIVDSFVTRRRGWINRSDVASDFDSDFGRVMERIQDYNRYEQALAEKLSLLMQEL